MLILLLKVPDQSSAISTLLILDPTLAADSGVMINKCIGPFKGFEKSLIQIGTPLLILIVFLLLVAIVFIIHQLAVKSPKMQQLQHWVPRFIRQRTLDDYKLAGVEVAKYVYMPFVSNCLKIFDCRSYYEHGKHVRLLFAQPDLECWVSDARLIYFCPKVLPTGWQPLATGCTCRHYSVLAHLHNSMLVFVDVLAAC